MLNQPSSPSMRALSPGAMMVFMSVWPVLKSFPATGTPRCSASCSSAGKSTDRLGAPLAYGTPSMMAAYAYSMEGAMSSWSASMAASNASMLRWTSLCLM